MVGEFKSLLCTVYAILFISYVESAPLGRIEMI